MTVVAPRLVLPRLPQLLARSIAASAAATIACAPVIARMSPELPLLGIIGNVVAVPLGEAAALPLCLLHALLSGWPAAERGAAIAASGALAVVRAIARSLAGGGVLVPAPTFGQIASVACASILWLAARRPRHVAAAAAAAVVVLEIAARRGPSTGALRVTILDVGQGAAALVDFPDGSLALVDGGGIVGSPVDVGERVLVPVLRARRRTRIDLVVLTHPHPDHFLGLSSVLGHVDVGRFWDTGQGEEEGTGGAYAELLASLRRRGVPIERPIDVCGGRPFGGATLEVLAPCPSVTSDRGPNDNSFVLRIRHGRRAFLFAGDAERALEDELVRHHGTDLRADVLKVGHHGSRTSSSPAFVDAVRPGLAVISSGVRNRFGHPHETTLTTFERAHVRVLRTDEEGAITIESDGASLDVRQLRSTTPMYGRFL
jgi:competence protein ComEC